MSRMQTSPIHPPFIEQVSSKLCDLLSHMVSVTSHQSGAFETLEKFRGFVHQIGQPANSLFLGKDSWLEPGV